jgi:RimJ/RimL family protein N-acetyltransferase
LIWLLVTIAKTKYKVFEMINNNASQKNQIHLTTPTGEIIVRPFELRDVDYQLSYIQDSPRQFLEQLGFDTSKLLDRESHKKFLIQRTESEQREKTFHFVVAQLNEKTIAAASLPLSVHQDVPRAHFHIYSEEHRGKGLGVPILKAALKLLMNFHQVNRIYIEPKIDNTRMNKLMSKAGFRFVEQTVFSGSVTHAFQANRYAVVLEMLD